MSQVVRDPYSFRDRSSIRRPDFYQQSRPQLDPYSSRPQFDPYSTRPQFDPYPQHPGNNFISGYNTPAPPPSMSNLDESISKSSATLDAMKPILEQLVPLAQSDFEKGIANYLSLLTGQLTEIKQDQAKLKQELSRTGNNSRQLSNRCDNMYKTVVKTEQYGRRSLITVTGLTKPENEIAPDLSARVATELSKSGVDIKTSDFSAVHRNSKENKTVINRGKEKIIPPSITVQFSSVSVKDNVLKSYRNFDNTNKTPRDVQIYQSLSPHYAELRRFIIQFFKSDSNDLSYGLSRMNKELKFVRYLSPSAGLIVKLKSDEFMRDIHTWDDFCNEFTKKMQVPS